MTAGQCVTKLAKAIVGGAIRYGAIRYGVVRYGAVRCLNREADKDNLT